MRLYGKLVQQTLIITLLCRLPSTEWWQTCRLVLGVHQLSKTPLAGHVLPNPLWDGKVNRQLRGAPARVGKGGPPADPDNVDADGVPAIEDEDDASDEEEQDLENEILAGLLAMQLADDIPAEPPSDSSAAGCVVASSSAVGGPPIAPRGGVQEDGGGEGIVAEGLLAPGPPSPPEARGAPAARRRGKPTAVMEHAGGVLAFYESNNIFQATCGNALHGSCVLSRKGTRGAHMKGRPVGLLSAWLVASGMYDTKEQHWAAIAEISEDQALRIAHRRQLAECPEGRALLSYERGAAAGGDPATFEPS